VGNSQTPIRNLRGVQQSFFVPPQVPRLATLEPKGVVYTKRWVVELLLSLAGYISDFNLVDAVAVEPAAGDGAFLGPMIERLVDSCLRLGRPISDCRDSLIAYELEEASAERARSLAVSILIERGTKRLIAEELAEGWVRTGDYLFEAPLTAADFVIGNPPYVRLEEIPEETAVLYRDAYPTMRGRADLYVAFFEAALRQLKEGGSCAFICADRWMRNQYGADLRAAVTADYAVDVVIEMHNADAFHDEVDAYPAITVIRRARQGSVLVASAGPEVETMSSTELANTLHAAASGAAAQVPQGLRIAKVDTWFEGNVPWPCDSPEQLMLLRRLEDEFLPLETSAKVGIGVATGNDRVFITKDAHLVEPSQLLKLALAKDISKGTVQWSGHYLVDPWNCEGLVSLDKFPRLQSYFESHSSALRKRHTAVKNVTGWYKTIDRVTHALTEKPKLYIADIKNSFEPVLDTGETYPHHNLYFIQSENWDLEVLGGLLMSAVGQFFIESYGVRMRGGYLRFQAQYLRRIRVPSFDSLSPADASSLRESFRSRDKQLATEVALRVYRIDTDEMERALGN
jgi:adenine-specific DNA-methyltransferase